MPSAGPLPQGITPTERYLNRLARRSFLSLWSYAGLYRDQGTGERGGEGAELCDLLVVFEKHILIFSDKDCEFPDIPDLEIAWRRWYKRAILKSAQQIWGAERWIRTHPTRLFLDRTCTQPFPIDLPDPQHAHFHRIVVAHDNTGRRSRLTGGTGSLLIDPSILGDAHFSTKANGGRPFAVGLIQPEKGYVHVLDEESLGRVMRTIDTITDFVRYLTKKEELILSGRLFGAYGEEDLLAYYLKNANVAGEHDFVLPRGGDRIFLQEGHWEDYLSNPQLQRKLHADRTSYVWDKIIERVAQHALAGTLLMSSSESISEHERMLRVLAREPRIRRRMLANALLEKVSEKGPSNSFTFRVTLPSKPGDPHYAFVVGSPGPEVRHGTSEWDTYRTDRQAILRNYCMVVMQHYQNSEQVIGIATESSTRHGRSYDVLQITRSSWDAEQEEEAIALKASTGWLTNLRWTSGVEHEYPKAPRPSTTKFHRKVGRNELCPCGSGRKLKQCHG
jgi:hypothetical protein